MADLEWTLAAGQWRATVSPFGASLRRVWLEGPGEPRDILWGYSGTSNKKGGQGDVLAPWPGRIRDGKYTFAGTTHQLAKNDKDGPNAIHGFLRSRTWDGEHDESTARLRTRVTAKDHAGYPFELEVGVAYEVLAGGLTCAIVARNAGDTPAPFGAGFHPYVLGADGVDSVRLHSPATRLVEFDGLLPTGRVTDLPADLDFRTPRVIGSRRFNHCFGGLARAPDGFARVLVDDVEVWMDGGFRYLVLYTGDALGADARRSLAIEPMTCATDAFNHRDLGLRVLAPGETVAATWGVTLRPAA